MIIALPFFTVSVILAFIAVGFDELGEKLLGRKLAKEMEEENE
jgi:hypothetical protein